MSLSLTEVKCTRWSWVLFWCIDKNRWNWLWQLYCLGDSKLTWQTNYKNKTNMWINKYSKQTTPTNNKSFLPYICSWGSVCLVPSHLWCRGSGRVVCIWNYFFYFVYFYQELEAKYNELKTKYGELKAKLRQMERKSHFLLKTYVELVQKIKSVEFDLNQTEIENKQFCEVSNRLWDISLYNYGHAHRNIFPPALTIVMKKI